MASRQLNVHSSGDSGDCGVNDDINIYMYTHIFMIDVYLVFLFFFMND